MKKTISLEVSKEAHEVAQGVANIVASVRAALADGWQPASDVPTVVLAVIRELGTAMQGADKMKDEWLEDRAATALALSVPIAQELLK